MKKYNLYDLYVAKVKRNKGFYYFICKYQKNKDEYVEIFSNQKLSFLDNSYIIPFYEYYTKSADESLFLTKKDLLDKYIEINKNNNLISNEKSLNSDIKLDEVIKKLEEATLDFFPKTGIWYSSCFKKSKELNINNLPCHLRDNMWLAKMMKKSQKLNGISINRILQFIKTSSLFKEKRHEYEQIIVKWQIDYMKNGGEGWSVDEEYGGDFCLHTESCDKAFRKGIVDTLSSIGINKDAIEEGIEKNKDMWRDKYMSLAFENQYGGFFPIPYFLLGLEEIPKDKEIKELEPVDQEFKNNWIKMRKYEYYQNHKESVDRYGIVETDMILSNEEAEKMNEYLQRKHIERKNQIDEYKEQFSRVKQKTK